MMEAMKVNEGDIKKVTEYSSLTRQKKCLEKLERGEKLRLAIVADNDLEGLIRGIKEGLERGEAWEVVGGLGNWPFKIESSQVALVAKKEPDVVLVMSLFGSSVRVRHG